DWSAMADWLGADPACSYRAAADRAIAAYAAPGVLDANVTMPWGEMPAAVTLNLLIADHVTHAWDLEQTTGIQMNIDDAVIEDAQEEGGAHDYVRSEADPNCRVIAFPPGWCVGSTSQDHHSFWLRVLAEPGKNEQEDSHSRECP